MSSQSSDLWKDFRREAFSNLVGLRTFLHTRRMLFRFPRAAMRQPARLGSRPVPFALQALLFPAVASWLLGIILPALIELPPTSAERHLQELSETIAADSSSGRASLERATPGNRDSVPAWAQGVDTAEARVRIDQLHARLEAGLRGNNNLTALLQKTEALNRRLDTIGIVLSVVRTPADLHSWEERLHQTKRQLDSIGLASVRANQALATEHALFDSLKGLYAARIAEAARAASASSRSAALASFRVADATVHLRAFEAANLRVRLVFGKLMPLAVAAWLVIAAVLFAGMIEPRMPRSAGMGERLYLYFLPACLAGPLLAAFGLTFIADLVGRFSLPAVMLPLRVAGLALGGWALFEVMHAARLIARVLVPAGESDRSMRTTMRVAGYLIFSQVRAAVMIAGIFVLITWPAWELIAAGYL